MRINEPFTTILLKKYVNESLHFCNMHDMHDSSSNELAAQQKPSRASLNQYPVCFPCFT
jgi:hypothetical protein